MELRTTCRCIVAGAAAALTLILTAGTARAGTDTTSAGTGKVSVGTMKVVSPAPAGTTTATPTATKTTTTKKKAKTAAATASKPESTAPASLESTSSVEAEKKEGGYTLKGGQDRTDFRSLTVEGEDRVHVTIDRPTLQLQLNPTEVTGLDFGTARDVLDRVAPDLTSQYLAVSATGRSPYTARPWLRQFASGSVARFQPAVRGTERWKLTVVDSRGQNVAQFGGKGEAPHEVVWDGRSTSGVPVTPGITYSYVFEAVDKAGNKRNFVGQGFRLSAYRLDSPQGPVLVFSGQALSEGIKSVGYGPGGGASRPAPPILLEAATALNQSPRVSQPIRVSVVGRSFEQANSMAKQVSSWLADLTMGDPTRVQPQAEVQADAPEGGTVRIALADGFGTPSLAPPSMKPVKQEKKQEKKKSKR